MYLEMFCRRENYGKFASLSLAIFNDEEKVKGSLRELLIVIPISTCKQEHPGHAYSKIQQPYKGKK